MKNLNTSSLRSVNTTSAGVSAHQSCDARAAFRLSGIELNPDLHRHDLGGTASDHWILQDGSLRAMVYSLVAAKRRCDAAANRADPRSDLTLAGDLITAMGHADTVKPESAWASLKFVASFTTQAMVLSVKLQSQQLAAVRVKGRTQAV